MNERDRHAFNQREVPRFGAPPDLLWQLGGAGQPRGRCRPSSIPSRQLAPRALAWRAIRHPGLGLFRAIATVAIGTAWSLSGWRRSAMGIARRHVGAVGRPSAACETI